MNFKNSKTCDPCRLILSFTYKGNLNRSEKYVALLNLSIFLHGKI